jgi:peptidoglycan hydrolase-like protein with peptidoglycan-binding domain
MTFGKDLNAFKAREIDWKRYWQRLPVFTRDLSLGDEGEDVRELQRFLNKVGYRISLFGAGAPGSETTYFGRATEAALIAFQKEHAIEPAAGYFGKITREVLRNRYSLT